MKKFLVLCVICFAFSSCYKEYTCQITDGSHSYQVDKRFRTKGAMNKWCGEQTNAFGSVASYTVADCKPKN